MRNGKIIYMYSRQIFIPNNLSCNEFFMSGIKAPIGYEYRIPRDTKLDGL